MELTQRAHGANEHFDRGNSLTSSSEVNRPAFCVMSARFDTRRTLVCERLTYDLLAQFRRGALWWLAWFAMSSSL